MTIRGKIDNNMKTTKIEDKLIITPDYKNNNNLKKKSTISWEKKNVN